MPVPSRDVVLEPLRLVVEANPQAVVVADAPGTILMASAAAERLFDVPRGALIGSTLRSLIPDAAPSIEDLLQPERGSPRAPREPDEPVAATPPLNRPMLHACRRDGSEFPAEIGFSTIDTAEGPLVLATVIDVSDRLRVEAALRESQAGYHSLMESLPLHVLQKDIAGRFVFCNRRFCESVQKTREELIGKTDFDLYPASLAQKYVDDDRRVIESGLLFDDIEENRHPDGTNTYVQIWKAPVRDAHGEVVGIQGMFWDVTEKKRAEDQRHESEARKQAIFEAALDCIITVGQDGRILEFNRAAERAFGYSRDEVLGQEMDAILFPPGSQDRYRSNVDRYSTNREEGSLVGKRHEVPVRRKNGSQFLAEMAMQPIPLKGQTAFTVFLRDITERKRAEDALRRSDARFRSLTRSNIIGIMIARLDGQITESNEEFLRIIDYTRDELKSGAARWDSLTPLEFRQVDEGKLHELTTTGYCAPYEKEYMRRDGTRIPVLLGAAMLEGTQNHCVSFVLDITRQKQQERELQAAKEAADAANRTKSAFLASMSHEIRTPMNSIIGMTDLVLDTRLTSEQRDWLAIAKDSAESLLSLINDVLDFSKIEAGRLDVNEVEFAVRDLVGGMLKTLAVAAHTRDLELVADIRPGVPDRVLGDATHLRQILVNLVGNSIKFTDAGEVVVQVDSQPAPGDGIELVVAVRDTGIGIPESEIARVFEPFEQVADRTRPKPKGTGLGLAITSRLVEGLQGRIWCESRLGRGTTFHFTARLKAAPSAPREEGDIHRSIRGLRVLVVDDNSSSRHALVDMLRSWGTQPVVAADARSAVTVVDQAGRADQPFDLCLIDARMPGVDGFALAGGLLKNASVPGERILMMLTSGDGSGDVARCEKLGIAAYLMKPINQSELFDTLVAVVCGEELLETPGPAHVEAADASPRARGLQILLTEDSLYNQKLAMAVLGKRGHRVTVANNGREALACLRRGQFDLILMDVQMPEMDGLEATRCIRAPERESGEHMPIIAMTAQALTGDRERCLAAGMDEYLSKPVRAAELHAAIDRLMGTGSGTSGILRRGSHDLRSGNGNGAAGEDDFSDHVLDLAETNGQSLFDAPPSEPALRELMDAAEAEECGQEPTGCEGPIDWKVPLASVGDDPALLRDVLDAFLEESTLRFHEMESALIDTNHDLLRRAAHTLKGGLAMLGASSAAEQAGAIEKLGHARRTDGAAALIPPLRSMVNRLIPQIQDYVNGGTVDSGESEKPQGDPLRAGL